MRSYVLIAMIAWSWGCLYMQPDKPPVIDTAPVASGWLDVVAGCTGTEPCEAIVPPGAHVLPAPLSLKSKTTMRFAPGATLTAAGWTGEHDTMIVCDDVTEVRILGAPGAMLVMSGVEQSEHRHAIRWRGCRDCELTDLAIVHPAGDGVYVGPTWDTVRKPSSGAIRRVSVESPYRAGVSVVATDGLLIEDLRVTGRAKSMSPHVALNFEPANPKDPIQATVVRAWLADGPSRQLGLLFHRSLADSVRRVSVSDSILIGGAWGISIAAPAGTGAVDVRHVTILSPMEAAIKFDDRSQIMYTLDAYFPADKPVVANEPGNLVITKR